CLSYIHQFGHCALLGQMDSAPMCTLPSVEMVRKTKDADCPVNFPQKPIDAGYIRNPVTVNGAIVAINTTGTLQCGTVISVIDVTLPDNSHFLLGNTGANNITWDGKLGSWIFKADKKMMYLRAAQCIQPPSAELG
ncbi:hypothetical protein PENTCL1PPCAC_4751, partial [Pristionchus entomophagus]